MPKRQEAGGIYLGPPTAGARGAGATEAIAGHLAAGVGGVAAKAHDCLNAADNAADNALGAAATAGVADAAADAAAAAAAAAATLRTTVETFCFREEHQRRQSGWSQRRRVYW